jgi:hypothetical protein
VKKPEIVFAGLFCCPLTERIERTKDMETVSKERGKRGGGKEEY